MTCGAWSTCMISSTSPPEGPRSPAPAVGRRADDPAASRRAGTTVQGQGRNGAGHRSGHLRLLVRGDTGVDGVVHVRDNLQAPPSFTARELMRSVLTLPADAPVSEALRTMRETRSHLAIVLDNVGGVAGLLTLTDVLQRLLPVTGATA